MSTLLSPFHCIPDHGSCRENPNGLGFTCDKAAVSRDMIKMNTLYYRPVFHIFLIATLSDQTAKTQDVAETLGPTGVGYSLSCSLAFLVAVQYLLRQRSSSCGQWQQVWKT